MDMKKISAACATAAALAALCVPGAAFAADGTLTLNAGDGSTLAGHSFTVYKVAGYNDVVKDGANVKSVSASSGRHDRRVGQGRVEQERRDLQHVRRP